MPDTRFLRAFIADGDVAAVRQSSGRLVARVLRHVPDDAAAVLEIGPGPGTLTYPLLRRLPPDARYDAIERNPDFLRHLGDHADPRLTVVPGDARRLEDLLPSLGREQGYDLALASIPFSRLTPEERDGVARAMADALRPGGVCVVFHQYTPLMRGPLRRAFGAVHTEFEPFNVLPCMVHVARKRSGSSKVGGSQSKYT